MVDGSAALLHLLRTTLRMFVELGSLEHITTVLIVCLTVNETALVGFLGRESHSTETETINSTSNAFRFCVAPIAATALFSAKCVATAQHNARRVLGDDWEQRYTALLVSCHDFDAAAIVVAGDDDANDDDANEPYNYHVVVSNPPYIPSADMRTLERTVVEYESPVALWGGSEDGMDVIRTIVQRLPEWCHPGASCWMEVDPTHPDLLREWLRPGNPTPQAQPQLNQQDSSNPSSPPRPEGVTFVGIRHDMFGRERFVQLKTVKD